MGSSEQSIEDGIGDRGLAQVLVPERDRELARDDGGTQARPVLDPRNVDRLFHAFLETAGLRRIRIHDLRHSAASIMLTSGATLDDVKRYLGHSSTSVTSDIYGHLVEGRSAEVADGIERAIRAKR
jgi:integrase